MKKIFTLLAVAIFALTAQALENYTNQVKAQPGNTHNYMGEASYKAEKATDGIKTFTVEMMFFLLIYLLLVMFLMGLL